MTDFPARGQQAPAYWDLQLKAYIDEHDAAVSGVANAAEPAAALDADVATKVNAPASATRGALDGLYSPLTVGGKRSVRKDELFINVKDYGALGDGATNDTTAIQNAITALATGGTLYFPPGNYVIGGAGVSLSKSLVMQGAGRDSVTLTSSLAYMFPVVLTGGPINVRIKGLTFSGSTSAQLRFSGAYTTSVDISECRFIGYSGRAIEVLGSRVHIWRNNFEGQGSAVGTAIYVDYGPHKVDIVGNTFRGGLQSVYVLNTNGVAKDVSVKDNTFDGMWCFLKANATGSGAPVTYAATTLTDTSAAFGALTVGSTVRVMASKVARTSTGVAAGVLTDTGANFTTAGVLQGDMVRAAGKVAIVDSVVSATVLKLEEWLDSTTYTPTTAPAATTAYTVYGTVIGKVVSNTATVITVDAWRNWVGTIATPAAGTMYELVSKGDYQGVRVLGASKVNVIGNVLRRGWADQISLNACTDVAILGNVVYDGQDVGITLESTGSQVDGYVVSGNQITHQGTAGIYLGNVAGAAVTGNAIKDPNWMSLPASTYGGIQIDNGATDAEVTGNVIKRVNHPNALRAVHITNTATNIRLRNKTAGYTGFGGAADLVITGTGPTGISGAFQANSVVSLLSSAVGPRGEFSGDGVPAIPASLGSTYLRRDGGAATTLYVKETASSSTTWAAK